MEITLGFLLLVLAAYTLLGGADFGGGILEATLWRHPGLRHKLQATLAPVWEANHVWLIAVVVILFVGFPPLFAGLCTMLYVPVSLALLGIIFRGAFFTFRKYDPEPEPRLALYGTLFRVSSALTPLMFGLILAALLTPFPRIATDGSADFAAIFIRPWATRLGLLCALFVFALFGYVAAVFFWGELDRDVERAVLQKRVVMFFLATFILGGVVLLVGAAQGVVPVHGALTPVQIGAHATALLCIPWLWWSLRRRNRWGARLATGVQVLCILAGWFATQYPVFMRFRDGSVLTVHNSHAPAITLFWLNIGLAVVMSFVIPLLAYLFKVFHASRTEAGFERS